MVAFLNFFFGTLNPIRTGDSPAGCCRFQYILKGKTTIDCPEAIRSPKIRLLVSRSALFRVNFFIGYDQIPQVRYKKRGTEFPFCCLFKPVFYLFLLNSVMNCSSAMVMDGALGFGASISRRNPASLTALEVVGPKAAIFVLFCLKSGKFCLSDFIPEGLKKTRIS